jgi:diaminopimelate decarboxylase
MQIMTSDNARQLAAKYGTPFYLYDLDEALARAATLKRALAGQAELLYCIKANANPVVVSAYRGMVDGVDLSSGGELRLARHLGFPASEMSFAGPGKTDEEIEQSIEESLGILSIESEGELARASALAARSGRTLNITLRINPSGAAKEFAMKMGGVPSQFGIPEEDAPPVVARALRLPGIRLCGFHVFSGTQCLEAPAIVSTVRATIDLACRLAAPHDFRPQVVNLGGGAGIAYFEGQADLDPEQLGSSIASTLETARQERPELRETRFFLEFGRFLIGRYGIYVTRVVDVKVARGKHFVILDGGMNHCFPATGNFGQLIKKNYPIRNLTAPSSREEIVQEIVGPLCTPIDSMGRAVTLPRCEPGDLIAFLNAGAYCYSASPLLFLSHDTPIELVRRSGAISVARPSVPAAALAQGDLQ